MAVTRVGLAASRVCVVQCVRIFGGYTAFEQFAGTLFGAYEERDVSVELGDQFPLREHPGDCPVPEGLPSKLRRSHLRRTGLPQIRSS